jgi:putative hydrolase of the HAD superfamily
MVVFDLDDTLYDYSERNLVATHALISELCEYSGSTESIVKAAFDSSRLTVKERLGRTGSSHSRLLYISETFRVLNLRPDVSAYIQLEELFWRTFLSEIELYPGAEKVLNLFRKNNVLLCLVTDLTSAIQYRKLDRLDLNGYFDFILTSEESGGDKPTNRPFEILESQMEDRLQNVWFFGDSDFDFHSSSNYPKTFFKKVRIPGVSVSESGFEYGDYFSLEKIVQASPI